MEPTLDGPGGNHPLGDSPNDGSPQGESSSFKAFEAAGWSERAATYGALMARATSHAAEPLLDGCPCPACAHGYSRAYLHYLLKAKEHTAMRLLTVHNLAYLQRLMAELRDAIDAGRFAAAADAVMAGAAPWDLGTDA